MPVENPPPARVLVVDDEPDITGLVAYHLAKTGYRVITAANGREALDLARSDHPDLVVLDLMLPGLSGFEVLAELRRRTETKDVGVILLTAKKDEPDRIKGLSLGADDYLAKPFSPQELVLRAGAVLRRLTAPAVSAGGVLAAGPVRLDVAAHKAEVDGEAVDLTATEFRLLRLLIEREGRVQDRTQLLETVRPAPPHEARPRGPLHRDRAGRGVPLPNPDSRGCDARQKALMRLATRFFLATSALVTVAVVTLTVSADHTMRDELVTRLEGALESDARLIAAQVPADSLAWSEVAHRLGATIGRRVTLIDPTG